MRFLSHISLSFTLFTILLLGAVFSLPTFAHAGGGGSNVRVAQPSGADSALTTTAETNTATNQCQRDAKVCPDGTTVGRTGPNCTFAPCTGGPLPPPTNNGAICPQDAKMCPNGTAVTRTGPNCTFPACPGGTGVIYGDVDIVDSSGVNSNNRCPAIQCPNGTFVSASAGPTCVSAEIACGGSSGNSNNGFACSEEAKQCPDGTTVWRTGPNCTFTPCTGGPLPPPTNNGGRCQQDAKMCPDGTSVTRTGPNCSFPACGTQGNTSDGLINTGTTPFTAGGSTNGSNTGAGNSVAATEFGFFGTIGNMIAGAASAVWNGVTTVSNALFGIGGGSASSDGSFTNLPTDGSTAYAGPGASTGGPSDTFTGGPNDGIACTMDAKICPDGTAVGRTGPLCEFADCPSKSPATTSRPVPGQVCNMMALMCADGTAATWGPNCSQTCADGTMQTPNNPIPNDLTSDEVTALAIAQSLGINTNNKAVQASIILAGKRNTPSNLRKELESFIQEFPRIDLEQVAEQAGLGITGTSLIQRAAESLRSMAGYVNKPAEYATKHAEILRYLNGTTANQ